MKAKLLALLACVLAALCLISCAPEEKVLLVTQVPANTLPPQPTEGSYYNSEINLSYSGYYEISYRGGFYKGELVKGMRSGEGEYTYESGAVYAGSYENDKRSGLGTMTYPDGSSFSGTYADNYENGQGTFTWANGDVYQGAFLNGAITGDGKTTYSNGNRFEGKYIGGVRQGSGVYYFATTKNIDVNVSENDSKIGVYKGTFVDGQMNDPNGYAGFNNGDSYTGPVVNGARQGEGVYTYADGSVFKGSFNDSLMDGPGELWNAEFNETFTGSWVNGAMQGAFAITIHDNENDVMKGNFVDNFMEGVWQRTYNTGGKITVDGETRIIHQGDTLYFNFQRGRMMGFADAG